ncbi:MAG: DMT family transporter [Bacillota bacterium]
MKTRLPAYLCLAAAMAIAGSSVVVGRILTLQLPVFLTSAASLFMALLVLAPLTWRTHRGLSEIPKGDLKVLFLQALTGIVLFRVFLLYGLRMTSATAGGIITSAMPAVVGLIAFLFLKEKPAWNKVGGIALSVAGVLAVNTVGLSADTARYGSLWGNLLVFWAVVGEALFTILQKKISKGSSALTRTALVSLFAFLSFLPFAVYEGLCFDFTSVRWSDGLCIAYYGVVVTAVAFILFYKGAAAVPASTAGVFAGFMPVSSVLLSNLILGERLMPCHLLGLGFVVAGIALMAACAGSEPRPADGEH